MNNKIVIWLALLAGVALVGCDRLAPNNGGASAGAAAGGSSEARLWIENDALKKQVEELTRLLANCSSGGASGGTGYHPPPAATTDSSANRSYVDERPAPPVPEGREVVIEKNAPLNEHDFDSCIKAREVCTPNGCYTPQPELNYCNKKYLQGQLVR